LKFAPPDYKLALARGSLSERVSNDLFEGRIAHAFQNWSA